MFYFWADTHFNHAGIIRHAGRGFLSVQEMNESLVARWNAQVRSERDEVWLLGDFGFHAPSSPETEDLGVLFWRLRGRKSLVVGNHDAKNTQVLRLPWERVETLVELKTNGRRAVLCHYPLESWPGAHHGALHFHGHCHGTLGRQIPHRFDVGADVRKLGPVSWEDLAAEAAGQTFRAQDHHGEGA